MPYINPSRLILARKRRGFSKSDLHKASGISLRSLTDYEKGAAEPTVLYLQRLARTLDFPVEFFSGPDLDLPPVGGTSYHSLARMTAKQQDQAESSAAIALALSDWINERFDIPYPKNFPRFQGVEPEAAAEAVRREWGLGEKPIRNMIHLLESQGVRVFSLVEECREVDAFSFWRNGIPYIFLNTVKTPEHARMDAAHELAHLILHQGHDLPRGKQEEFDAKLFAGAFLMPRADLLAEVPRGPGMGRLIQAKRRWKVSLIGLVYRLHKVGLLTDWEYRNLIVELSRRGYRTDEPNGIERRETSKVLAKVFAALRTEGITKSDVARDLRITVEELNKSIFGLVLTHLQGEGERTPSRRTALRLV